MAEEFVQIITGVSDKAPETAAPKHQGVGQAPWEHKGINEVKWWDATHIRQGEEPERVFVVTGALDTDIAPLPEVPVTVPAGAAGQLAPVPPTNKRRRRAKTPPHSAEGG
eukprot:13840751-Alexandrium_andersonii.AAC.1